MRSRGREPSGTGRGSRGTHGPGGARRDERVRDPFGRSASGPTADAAVANLRADVSRRVMSGELVQVTASADNPLMKWAGTWENDPFLDDFRRAVEQFRTDREADPDAP